jgi:hypothetical protein
VRIIQQASKDTRLISNLVIDLHQVTRIGTHTGEMMTDAGVMNLQRNATLFMRRDQVEPLIRQGIVEHVQTSVQ